MIDATALVCDEQQQFSLEKVSLPDPGPDEVAVACHFSGVSVGTEFAVIKGKLDWGPFPVTTGYMGTGVVERVGASVTKLELGDKVYYRSNRQIAYPDGRPINSAAGVHCSHAVFTPGANNGGEALPSGVPLDVASMFVMPAVGLHGVDMANPRAGDRVVVVGVGLIGLGVVSACANRGCDVIAVDVSDRRLELARELGAEVTVRNAKSVSLTDAVLQHAPEGADVVFECTGIPALIDDAIALARKFGTFVWQGNYGDEPITMRFLVPHGKQLKMHFPSNDGLQPCRRAVLRNMKLGALRWDKAISHVVESKDAPRLYEKIRDDAVEDLIGATIRWRA